jgi:hypothetical protein
MTSALLKTLLLLLACTSAAAAQSLALKLVPGYQMRIEGTSNLRDWGADVNQIDIEFVLKNSVATISDLRPEVFEKMTLNIPVQGISSSTRGLTGKIHKYLKKKKHPAIIFALEQVIAVEQKGDSTLITAQGIINAAGKDQQVTLQVVASADENGHITISGSQPLTMTGFDIKPPTAVFATIKAVDAFEVRFNLSFSR